MRSIILAAVLGPICVIGPVFVSAACSQTLDPGPNAQTACLITGQQLTVSGDYSSQADLKDCYLEVDRQQTPLHRTPVVPTDHYSFLWTATEPGLHNVRVAYVTAAGVKVYARKMVVNVPDKAPLALVGLPDKAIQNFTLSAKPQGVESFAPANVEILLDDTPIPGVSAPAFTTTVNVETTPAGFHSVQIRATDAHGTQFLSPAAAFVIPSRVTLTMPPAVTLRLDTDQVPFTADICPGYDAEKVEYSVDGQPVATATAAPFAAQVSLTAFKSGTHIVRARTYVKGVGFDGPDFQLVLKNLPEDARLAQRDKEEADRQAKAAKEEADREAAVQMAQAQAEMARANAAAAAEARKDNGPMGPARKVLRSYLAAHADLGWRLVDVKDVRKSESEIYPTDIYAIVSGQFGQSRYIFSANMNSQDVSDYVKKW